jgi:hypothetical protein
VVSVVIIIVEIALTNYLSIKTVKNIQPRITIRTNRRNKKMKKKQKKFLFIKFYITFAFAFLTPFYEFVI